MPGGASICRSRGLKNASACARAASGEVRISLTVLFLFQKTGGFEKGSSRFVKKRTRVQARQPAPYRRGGVIGVSGKKFGRPKR
jgi:hypothetical protein